MLKRNKANQKISTPQVIHLVVSQNYGYPFGAPIIRTIVFWGLYWGSLLWEIAIYLFSTVQIGDHKYLRGKPFRSKVETMGPVILLYLLYAQM